MRRVAFCCVAIICLFSIEPTTRGDDRAAKDVPVVFLADHLLTAAGAPIDNGILIVSKGKIVAVGTKDQVTIPDGATVSTVGIRSLLVTYSWPENSVRYNRIAKFVREFFGKIDQFHDGSRHPKWEEISLAAEMPGWTRFKPAADWLTEHRAVALKPAFDQFVQSYTTSSGQKGLSDRDRELLFVKFQQFLQQQSTAPGR